VVVTLVMWVVGVFAYAVLALAGSPWSADHILWVLFYGSMMTLPAVLVYWVLCVPALMLVRRALGGCRPVVAFPLVSGAVQAGFIVAVCSLLPTCSARETVLLSILHGILGVVGGVGYAWSCGYGRR